MDPINQFRSSGARRIEAKWQPGSIRARNRLRNAIRRITNFFLRPWDGTGDFRQRWIRKKNLGHITESERGVPETAGGLGGNRKLLSWITGLIPTWRVRADFVPSGNLSSQLLPLKSIPEGNDELFEGIEDLEISDAWLECETNNLLQEPALDCMDTYGRDRTISPDSDAAPFDSNPGSWED